MDLALYDPTVYQEICVNLRHSQASRDNNKGCGTY